MTPRRTSQAGFTLIEMMIATMIMVAVTAAVFTMMNPAQGTYQTQPEVADMQQRMRVAVDVMTKDIVMAGAGVYMGASSGSLSGYFASLMPYRVGDVQDDPAAGVFYRADTISMMYVPPTAAQTGVNKAMGNGNSQEIDVDAQKNCGANVHSQLCGFKEQMRVLIMDTDGTWDYVTITNVQNEALHLQHSDKLTGSYNSGAAVITEVAAHTYYLKSDIANNTFQLMHYDGAATDTPIVDNVVKLQFSYYGDPQPPTLLPGAVLTNTVGPWVTYGPKPPALGVNNSADTWGAGENCTFMVSNGQTVSRLPVLAANEGEVLLTQAQLTDGPWCPDDARADRFDADLLRIRKVRVNLRVQAALASLRGPTGVLFTRGGTSTSSNRYVPDQEVRFDVTPRNLNLGR
ncbi:MAG TPA: prepilin-type N-terminal cleavage/methylation domain-containing protein [Vicinamibacterales bacterium]|jgi:prepilin-type N-terminal cleavage/methylation domain-containing protein|nr:prepilin-type N-terminal cleavage/methylation domain-containing protein [Vicinamibacterales bacterium]